MPPHASKGLTPHQRTVLGWIKGFVREHGMPPTVREIGAAFEIESSSVFYLLKELERKGALERGDLGSRSLTIAGMSRARRSDSTEVPIIGRIAAGCPIEAIENETGKVTVQATLLRGRPGYALQVVGDSMIEAGILDGDYVIIRKQDTANNGDVVVALVENEATLKRFHREGGGVRLEPANKKMRPIHVRTGEFRIQGKVVYACRMMDDPGGRSK